MASVSGMRPHYFMDVFLVQTPFSPADGRVPPGMEHRKRGTMPVRPRNGSSSTRGTLFFLGRRGTVSLAAIVAALSVAGPRMVVEVASFLIPAPNLGGFDAGAAALPRRAGAASQLGRSRGRFSLLGRERTRAGVSRASMDDEDEEFVVVSCFRKTSILDSLCFAYVSFLHLGDTSVCCLQHRCIEEQIR